MKPASLFLIFLFLISFLHQTVDAQVDLSKFDQAFISVTTPDDTKFDVEKKYLSGLLVSYLRGTEAFTRVHFARDDASQGVLLDVAITQMKVVGSGARFFGGALTGKDKLAANVRFVDLTNGMVLAETTVDGSGSRGFLWNIGGATIYSAMSNFADSTVAWAGYGDATFGKPLDWGGKIDRETPIAVRCTGIERKSAGTLVRYKQSNETICAALKKKLESIQVRVTEDSATILHLTLEAMASAGTRNEFKPVLIMRWLVEGPGGVLHDDVVASTGPAANRKGARSSAAEVVSTQIQIGVDALWAH